MRGRGSRGMRGLRSLWPVLALPVESSHPPNEVGSGFRFRVEWNSRVCGSGYVRQQLCLQKGFQFRGLALKFRVQGVFFQQYQTSPSSKILIDITLIVA